MIKVLLTSPRVAPGLLTRAAWQALEQADEIGAATGTENPAVQALIGSGLVVTTVTGEPWAWLTEAVEADRQVVWLAADDGDPALLRLIADHLTQETQSYQVEIVHGSYDVPGARLLDLVQVMDRLRRNCPWDQEQTHESLAKYLLEETYETLEAIDAGDPVHLREELGDLLLQVVFHSRVAEDDAGDGFTIDDVAAGIVDKLIRRHPHVFGTVHAADAAAVEANWESIKAAEKQRSSVLEGIPTALPALALADKVLSRAAKLLGDHPPIPTTAAEELGHRLLDLVAEARAQGIDAEQALRTTVHQLATHIRTTESTA